MSGLQHALTCAGPRVSVQHGLNRDLHTCRSCSASLFVERLRTGEVVGAA